MLRFLPGLTIALFLGPVAAGLLGTVLPSLGYLPALGGERLSLEPWRQLAARRASPPRFACPWSAASLSTAAALALTILVFAAGHGTRTLTRAKQSMTPVLAVPHLAMAVGLAFLIAPSGWLVRLAIALADRLGPAARPRPGPGPPWSRPDPRPRDQGDARSWS